jgi:Mycolic acid cyclopropane synthetase
MDHICRKLKLGLEESVADAGCGCGVLALHMATRYYVPVNALNVSREQTEYAKVRPCATETSTQWTAVSWNGTLRYVPCTLLIASNCTGISISRYRGSLNCCVRIKDSIMHELSSTIHQG